MLVLTRKLGEQIVLPDAGVLVTVLGISENRVRLGVAAPAEQRVHRREIWERMRGDRAEPYCDRHPIPNPETGIKRLQRCDA